MVISNEVRIKGITFLTIDDSCFNRSYITF